MIKLKSLLMKRGLKLFAAISLALLFAITLTTCGGGGGSSNSSGGSNSGGGGGGNYTLTVDKFGEGAIVSDKSGINCGNDCSEAYTAGTQIILTATPGNGYQFNSWSGCDSSNGNTCTVTLNFNKTILPTFGLTQATLKSTTVILDNATMQYLVNQVGTTYYFNSQATVVSNLQSGDVIVSSSGNGLLRRVTSVYTSANGLIVVETTDATLEDTLEEGTISWTGKLTQANLKSAKALIKGVELQPALMAAAADFTTNINAIIYDGDGDNNTTNDQIRIVGSATTTFEPDFALSIGWTGIKEFKSVLITQSSQSLSVEAGGSIPFIDIKIPIQTFYFQPIPVSAIPPIVLVPEITLYVGIKGEAGATLTTGVSMQAVYTAGVYYKRNEGWRPVSDYSQNSGYTPPSITANASIKGFLGPEFKLFINAVAGPTISVEGYLKAQAGVASQLWWKIYGGIGAFAGGKVEILSWVIGEYKVELIIKEWLLASSDTTSISDTTSPSIPSGITASAISSSRISLSWNASTDDTGVEGYRIYRDGAYLKSVTTLSASDTGLSSNTQYCYTVSAYDIGGNESGQSSQVCATTYPVSDTTSPSIPTGLSATAVSSSQINLSWNASTDNIGVAGYKIYRNGISLKSTATTSYSNTGLSPSTQFCYTVSAYDAAGNESGQSSQACATTNARDLTGAWSGTWASAGGVYNGNLTVSLIQSGSSINGTVNISGSPCISSGNVSGTVSGNNVSIGVVSTSGADTITYNGTSNATSITGTYSVTGGACAGDTGTFILNNGGGGSPAAVLLPETGQTTCYDTAGNVIACAGTGQDGELQMGVVWPSPRFTDNGNGTVTDNLTGLMWLKDANCIATQYPGFDSDGMVTWQNSLNFVAGINSGTYSNCGAGYTDWRLPNIKELRSLINYSQGNPATWLNTQGFSNVQASNSSWYWSSSTFAIDTNYAYGFIMNSGRMVAGVKGGNYYAWPVRAGGGGTADLPKTGQTTSYATGDDGDLERGVAWPSPRFTDNGNGTVTDNLTGLMWLKDANCIATQYPSFDTDGTAGDGAVRWQNALNFVAGINSGTYSNCGAGYTDWRLPNVNELESLINAEQANLATWLNTQGFSNVQANFYWSSSTYAFNAALAWFVYMSEGLVLATDKTNTFYVWPVRGGTP